jgi:membrane protein required for beta-lactamase induction
MSTLQLLQLIAQKASLLVDVETIALGMLIVLFGRRFKAGWRSHTQQIVIGLSTASIAQLAMQGVWETIARTAVAHSMADYERIVGLREKLFNTNTVVYLAVLVWWIVCLWIDEPETSSAAPVRTELSGSVSEAEASTVEQGEESEGH